MKLKSMLISAAVCAVGLSTTAAEPLSWERTPNRPAPAQFDVFHGESLDFRCTFTGFGALPFAGASDVRLWYQTNGMGAAWWSIPATVSSNALAATFTPDRDPGAERLAVFFGAPSNAYASASVRFRHSPGFTPNALTPPFVLDWAEKLADATNALAVSSAAAFMARSDAYTKEETDARIVELAPVTKVNGKTGAVNLAATDVGAFPSTGGVVRIKQGGGIKVKFTGPTIGAWGSSSFLDDKSLYLSGLTGNGLEINGSGDFRRTSPVYGGATFSLPAVYDGDYTFATTDDISTTVTKEYVESLGIESGVSEATVTNVVRSIAYAVNDYVWDGDVCWRRQMLQGGYLEYVAVTNIDVTLPENYKALEALENARRNQE